MDVSCDPVHLDGDSNVPDSNPEESGYEPQEPGREPPESVDEQDKSMDEDDAEEEVSDEAWAAFKIGLHTHLDSIHSGGRIASVEHYSLFVNPGLEILGRLPIPLPLCPGDAETMRDACRQAPFGRGDDTVVDTSVRKTWELDHTQFRLRNPAWDTFLTGTLLKKAAQDLGLESVRAEPYKLLLYEPGSFFKPHRDSEKTPGMVATLVICLPSDHRGGDVHLSFGGTALTLSTGPTSKHDLTALAWYSDVTHEVRELTHGHRLVLTYNIVLETTGSESPTLFIEQANTLREMLLEWTTRFTFVEKACYTLAHKYSKSSLSLSILKGRDAAMFSILKDVAAEAGFYLFAGHMTYSVEEEGWGDEAAEPRLSNIFAPDGTLMVTTAFTSMDELLYEAQYENRTPDSIKRGEFTGNASMPDTLRYHDTVIILMPKESIMSVVGTEHIGSALSIVLTDLERHPNDSSLAHTAASVMRRALTANYNPSESDLAKITTWAVRLGKDDIFELVTQLGSEYSMVLQAMANALVWKCQHPRIWSDEEKASFAGWDQWFRGVLRSPGDVHELRRSISTFEIALSDAYLARSFGEWAKTAALQKLDSQPVWMAKDLETVQTAMLQRHDEPGWLVDWLIPKLGTRGHRQILVPLLLWAMQPKAFQTESFVTSVIQVSRAQLALNAEDFSPRPRTPSYPYTYIYTSTGDRRVAPPPASLSPSQEEFLELLDGCLSAGLFSSFLPIIATTNLLVSGRYQTAREGGNVVKFLTLMAGKLEAHRPAAEPQLASLYKMLLTEAVDAAGIPPYPVDEGWSFWPRGCRAPSCAECRDLDDFLRSPTQVQWRLQRPAAIRNHIQNQMGPPGAFTTDTQRTTPALTLVITKKITTFRNGLMVYKNAVDSYESKVSSLNTEYMRELLGDEDFRRLVTPGSVEQRTQQAPVHTMATTDITGPSIGSAIPPAPAPCAIGSTPHLGSGYMHSRPAAAAPSSGGWATAAAVGSQKRPSDDGDAQYDGREKRFAITIDD